jgi:diguanylate cyclase (GGDEF)-like protein
MIQTSVRMIGWVASIAATIIALLPPAGYLSLSYLREKGEMIAEAELIAQMVTMQVIGRNPDLGRQESHRFTALIEHDFIPADLPEQRRVLDFDGSVIASTAQRLRPPVLTVPVHLRDAGRAIGRVEVRRSLLPLLLRSLWVALFGIALALAVYLLPLRAVRDAYARLEHQATHDVLTGLPNRKLIEDRLALGMAHARRSSTLLAVAFLDLDNFKLINDKLGHGVGDALLQAVAARLRSSLREGDTVGRQGGDEFVMILPGNRTSDAVPAVMQRLMKTMAVPLEVGKHLLHVTCSIGISLFPRDGEDADLLMRRADAAMYLAKGQGRNKYQFFAAEINKRLEARRMLERELEQALAREEFELYYQPQVDISDRTICGAEALLRWRHPRRGLLSPVDFLAVAQDSHLVLAIDEWVTRTACFQAKAWQRERLPQVRIAINASDRIQDERFVELVRGALDQSGLDSSWLELELDESVLFAKPDQSLPILRAMRGLGVGLAIDNFGMASCTLSYLRRLPVDRLKVDRSLIGRIGWRASDDATVEGVISLGHALRLRMLAQGVETAKQLELLRSRHCDEAQGRFLHPVLSADAFGELLASGSAGIPGGLGRTDRFGS